MLERLARAVALVCAATSLGMSTAGATAEATGSQPKEVLQPETVRQTLQAAGYSVSAPVAWADQAMLLEARGSDATVRAFVYRDTQAARAARRASGSVPGAQPDDDDVGPQLLSGFGASAWLRNVALVQSRPDTFAELMPAELDCSDLAPPPGPDLSKPKYRVDPTVLALVDALQ